MYPTSRLASLSGYGDGRSGWLGDQAEPWISVHANLRQSRSPRKLLKLLIAYLAQERQSICTLTYVVFDMALALHGEDDCRSSIGVKVPKFAAIHGWWTFGGDRKLAGGSPAAAVYRQVPLCSSPGLHDRPAGVRTTRCKTRNLIGNDRARATRQIQFPKLPAACPDDFFLLYSGVIHPLCVRCRAWVNCQLETRGPWNSQFWEPAPWRFKGAARRATLEDCCCLPENHTASNLMANLPSYLGI